MTLITVSDAACSRVLLLGLLLGAGCQARSSDAFSHIGDVFCDGKSVSIVCGSERSVRAKQTYFSGGYLISQRQDSWLVSWSLQDDNTLSDPTIVYLGKYIEERAAGGGEITRQEGHPWSSILATDENGIVLVKDARLLVLEHGVEHQPRDVIQPQHGKGRGEYVFTRARTHMFAWLPEPSLYSIPSLKVVKRLPSSEACREFERLCSGRTIVKTLLTQDLAYLIAVLRKGASASGQDKHIDAVCYSVKRDELSTVTLEGLGDASIWDAEPIADSIHWLVVRDWSQGRWAILESDSRIVAEFSLPPQFRELYWDPSQELVWVVQTPMSSSNLGELTRIAVSRFKTSESAPVVLQLRPADLAVPE